MNQTQADETGFRPVLGKSKGLAVGSPLAGAFRSASKLAAYDERHESVRCAEGVLGPL
jgi:hypothetical protein